MQRVDREGRWYVTYSGGTATATHRLPCYARIGTQNVDSVDRETSRSWKIAVERKRPFLRERAFRCQGAAGGAGPRHRSTRQRVTSRYIPMAASNGTSVRKIPPSAAGRVDSFSPVNSRGARGSPDRAPVPSKWAHTAARSVTVAWATAASRVTHKTATNRSQPRSGAMPFRAAPVSVTKPNNKNNHNPQPPTTKNTKKLKCPIWSALLS